MLPVFRYFFLHNPLMTCHEACPGRRHSQKFQPLTLLPVILTAAAEGLTQAELAKAESLTSDYIEQAGLL